MNTSFKFFNIIICYIIFSICGNITSTISSNNVIEIQAFPDSNDVVGLKDLYLSFDVTNSKINTIKDVIASGEDVSGVVFSRDYYTSSYSNGELERK